MKIDQLPVEMLMKIFNYLPSYGEVSAVNRRFYGIACAVNESNICLRIDEQFCKRFLRNDVNNSQWQQSIFSSNRQISAVEIEGDDSDGNYLLIGDGDERGIISVIAKFSETITFLKFADISMDEFTFMEILSLIPNVEHLKLQEICTKQRTSKRRRCKDDLNLKKLRSLSIVRSSEEFVRAMNLVPVGVLSELEITCPWNSLAEALDRQCNIKKLKYVQDDFDDDDGDGDQICTNIFDNLKLESLTMWWPGDIDSMTVAALLAKQTKLKSLILNLETVFDEQVMDAVACLTELQVLSMNVMETQTRSLAKIRRLKQLQDLELRCVDEKSTAQLMAFADSANISIRKLSWEFGFRMSVDLVGALAKSVPNLTHLNVLRSNLIHSADLDAILCHFNFLEVLHVSIWGNPLLNPGNYFNAKLKDLTIFAPFADQFYKLWLTKLIEVYPNLQKFILIVRFPDTRYKIRPILDGFKKLESLTLETSPSQMVIDDLHYLHDHKNNLKFVFLGRLNKVTLTNELVGKLRANFGVVNVSNNRNLSLAVDRYAMMCRA